MKYAVCGIVYYLRRGLEFLGLVLVVDNRVADTLALLLLECCSESSLKQIGCWGDRCQLILSAYMAIRRVAIPFQQVAHSSHAMTTDAVYLLH